jgi:hypothetical protein
MGIGVASSRLRGEDLLGYHLILLVVDLQTYLVGIAVGALSIFSMFHCYFVCTESPILDVSTTSKLCFFLEAMGLVDSSAGDFVCLGSEMLLVALAARHPSISVLSGRFLLIVV